MSEPHTAPPEAAAASIEPPQGGAGSTASGRPFLKWAGGKQWLAPFAPHLLPPDFAGRYYEPFVGAGAMFFALRPDRATISDVNIDLMNTYRALKRDPELLIQTLLSYEHSRAFYDMVRQKAPPSANGQAARLIYLNKTAFNGLYRVNRSGEFNVPFGRYRNPGICQPDRIREASHALRRARILHGDFAEAVAPARSDDLVYMDPPYITGHTNNGFVKYNAPLFSWHDQIRLSTTARSLFDRGVHVIVSNADHGSIRALYFDFFVYRMRRRILVGVQGSRRLATELLISSRRIGALEDRLVKT